MKTIPWKEFFTVSNPAYVTFKIIPDTSTRNYKTEDVMKTIAEQFKLPIDRLSHEGIRVRYEALERSAFEIVLEGGSIRFYFSTPEPLAPLMKRRLRSVWPDASIEEAPDYPVCAYDPEKTSVYEVLCRKHHLYSIHTDSKDNLPLGSLFEAGRLVGKEDKARVVSYFEPIHYPSYASEMRQAWKKYREGHAPKKWDPSGRELAKSGLLGIATLLKEFVDAFSTLFSNNPAHLIHGKGTPALGYHKGTYENAYTTKTIDPEANSDAVRLLHHETKEKPNKQATKTYLWVISECATKERSDLTARTLASAFTDLNGDNELVAHKVKKAARADILRVVATKAAPRVNLRYNLFSTAESSKVLQIPGRELIESFPEIEHLDIKEVQIDERLTKEGLWIATATYKGQKFKVFQPCPYKENEKAWDQYCLPDIVVGGMGQGKTKGFGANRVVEAVLAGFGAVCIDPAKGEMGDEIEAILGPDKVERYNLAKMMFALDWSECMYSTNGKSRLASTVFSFFDGDDGSAAERLQTKRFIRAGVFAMETGRLKELIRIFEDKEYRQACMKKMPDGLHKTTLAQFDAESEARQRQILSPIYNRLDMILGDPFLEECLDCEESLDMVALTSKRKAIIFDVPTGELLEAADILVNLLFTKIYMAMSLRTKENQFPCTIVIDEPHQYLRSTYLWRRLCTESRKWRFKMTFMFHQFEQLDRSFRKIVKAALPHYFLYPSSKDTFRELEEEMYPFTLEQAMRLPDHHAINIIRSGSGVITPFVAHMTPPPSKRKGEVLPSVTE